MHLPDYLASRTPPTTHTESMALVLADPIDTPVRHLELDLHALFLMQHAPEWLDDRDAATRDAAAHDTSREVAMATVTKSTTIPASVDAVWAVVR